MNKFAKCTIGISILAIMVASCSKKVDAIDTYSVNVNYNNKGANYVTGDVSINPKDSIFFDFTITSAQDMGVVEIQKNGVKIDTFVVTDANRRSFSGLKKYMSDSTAGTFAYRILARTAEGKFLGDGDKLLKVTVKPDFLFWSYRSVYVPDSTEKKNNTYFSSSTGQLFSFTSGSANSGLIDFGYYYDTTTANKHTIYALSGAQTQLNFYDITSWTKNATIFKKAASPAFNTLTSGGALKAAGILNLASGTTNKITALASGNLVFFKTAAGKSGCIQVSFINGASAEKTTFINIDVKVQN